MRAQSEQSKFRRGPCRINIQTSEFGVPSCLAKLGQQLGQLAQLIQQLGQLTEQLGQLGQLLSQLGQ